MGERVTKDESEGWEGRWEEGPNREVEGAKRRGREGERCQTVGWSRW